MLAVAGEGFCGRRGLAGPGLALTRAAAARAPAAADGSPAGTDAVDLLAYMLGRVSRRAEELAGVADRARIAGLTCERRMTLCVMREAN